MNIFLINLNQKNIHFFKLYIYMQNVEFELIKYIKTKTSNIFK